MLTSGADERREPGDDGPDPSQVYQGALRTVTDVMGVNVDQGRIQILAREGRSPRVLARDVRTVLLTALGEPVEDGTIDVVQIGGGDSSRSRLRIKVGSISVSRDGARVSTSVSLKLGPKEVSGQARTSSGAGGEEEALALATMGGIEQLLGRAVRLQLIGVREVRVRGFRAQMVLLEWVCSGEITVLLGSSLVRRSASEAVVKAVLDAVNRFVSWYPA